MCKQGVRLSATGWYLSWLVSFCIWSCSQNGDRNYIITLLAGASLSMPSPCCVWQTLHSLTRLMCNPMRPKQDKLAKELLKEFPECSLVLLSDNLCISAAFQPLWLLLKAVPLLSCGICYTILLCSHTEGTDCMFRLQIQSSDLCFLFINPYEAALEVSILILLANAFIRIAFFFLLP